MDTRVSERLGAVAGLVASLAVGVPVLLDTVATGGERLAGPPTLWWACYLGYLAAFAVLSQTAPVRRPGWLHDRTLLAVQGALGAASYALAPDFGWTVVPLIVTAATAAYELARPAVVAVVAAQAALTAVVSVVSGIGALEAATAVVVYTSFQAFAVFVIWTQQREADSRARLAVAHAELRTANALLEASSRAAERLRIARDLHDLVGHQLTALSLELEVATNTSRDDATTHVVRARSIARDLLGDVREVVGELRTSPRGLRAAIEHVTGDLPRPRVELAVDDDLEVADDVVLALLRCVQEIVTNTLRHADADHLRIEVVRTAAGGLRLATVDDGRGVERLQPGNGLTGIRERISALGGSVRFTTARGQGMQVEAELPPG